MIEQDVKQLTISDGTNILNGTVSIDVGQESGIGSDSDSNIGVDPALTPTTPSSHPIPAFNLDGFTGTSGHMISIELLSVDENDWRYVAERYTSDLPHDAINVRLDEEYAHYVIPPPPPLSAEGEPEIDLTAEVDSINLPTEKRPSRRLPALPTNETSFDQFAEAVSRSQCRQLTEETAAAQRWRTGEKQQQQQQARGESAELWRKAASVDNKDRVTGGTRHRSVSTNHIQHIQQTGTGPDETHAHASSVSVTTRHELTAETLRQTDDSSQDVIVSTLPQSRARRQPISDVAPASFARRTPGGNSDAPTGTLTGGRVDCVSGTRDVMTSQRDAVCDVTGRREGRFLETFRPVERTGHTADHVNDRTTDRPRHALSRCQDEQPNDGHKLDRKWTENGTDDRNWRKQLNGNAYQPGDVIKPDMTSDWKHHRQMTSPDRDRKQHVISQLSEVGVAGVEVGHPQNTAYTQHAGRRSSERGMTSTKLLERRLAGSRGGRITPDDMRIMVDRLNTKQRQIQAAERQNNNYSVVGHGGLVATSGELDRDETSTGHGRFLVRQCSAESRDSQPSSPITVEHDASTCHHSHPGHGPNQHVTPEPWAPVRHQNVSADIASMQQSCPGLDQYHTGRSMRAEYEAGLRIYGPNHRPEHWTIDDQRQQQAAISNGAWNGHRGRASVDSQSRDHRRQLPSTPRPSLNQCLSSTASLEMLEMVDAAQNSSRGGGGATQRQTSTPSSRPSSHSTWQSVQDISQSSLPRFFRSAGDRRAPAATDQSQAAVRQSQPRHPPIRSSSAQPFNESAIDVELHRPLPQSRDVSRDTSAAPSPEVDRRSMDQSGTGTPPKSSLARRIDKFFRRSESESSSREPSPSPSSPPSRFRWPSPGKDRRVRKDSKHPKDSSKDSKDGKDGKDGKVKSASKNLLYRKRYENITTEEMLSATTDVMSSSAVDTRVQCRRTSARKPIKCDVPVPPTTSSAAAAGSDQQTMSTTSAEPDPVDSQHVECTSSVGGDGGNTGGEGQGHETRSHLKLPSLPVDPSHAPPRRPQQVKIHLTETEQVLVDKRYDGQTAVNQAVSDIKLLMTSSFDAHVTTPTSDTDVTSASDKDGSRTADSGSGEPGRQPRALVEGSFRRVELVPSVRRFISLCERLSLVATDAERAHEFNTQLTDSLRALIALLAVNRRADYGARGRDLLNTALRRVAESYCVMVEAAGPAVGLSTDDPVVIRASERAADLADQLSALLTTVQNVKSQRSIAYF